MSKYEMSVACLLGGIRKFIKKKDSEEEAKKKTMLLLCILRIYHLLNLDSLRGVKKIREPSDTIVRQNEMW